MSNDRRVSRIEAGLDVLLAVLVGVFAMLAIAHWCGWLLKDAAIGAAVAYLVRTA